MNLRKLSSRQLSYIQNIVFVVCLLPLVWLGGGLLTHRLGANPIEAITRGLGDWALYFLLITLTITPLSRWTKAPWLIKLRRLFGLYGFGYASLHLLAYALFDQSFDLVALLTDIRDRPFITIGMLCFLLLLPLAITSNQAMMRRLGGQRWLRLHQLIYLIAPLAVFHFWQMVKIDVTQPLLIAVITAFLLGLRAKWRWQKHRTAATRLQPGNA